MPYAWVYPIPFTGFQSRFNAYQSIVQAIPNAIWTLLNFGIELFDTLNEFNLVTDRFQPVAAGYYLLIASVGIMVGVDQKMLAVDLRVNGATVIANTIIRWSGASYMVIHTATVIYLTPADFVEAMAYQDSGVAQNTSPVRQSTYFAGQRLS